MPRLPYPAITSGCAGRPAQRLEQFRADIVGVAGHRADQAPVGAAVGAEAGGGLGHRAGHDRGAAAVERIGELDLGPCEPDAARGQVEALEERRRHGQRVRGRADVVPEAGQGELLGPAATPDLGRALDHLDLQARRGQGDGSGQPVRAAADYHRVRVPRHESVPCAYRDAADGRGRRMAPRWSAARCGSSSCARCCWRDATGVWSPRMSVLVSTSGSGTPSRSPSAVSVAAQNLSSLRCPPNVIATSYSGSFARISTRACTTVSPSALGRPRARRRR